MGSEHVVPRPEEPRFDLGGRRHRIRRVTAEHQDVSSRQRHRLAAVLTFDLVFGGHQLGDRAAHLDVVAGVRHVVDENVAIERLGYRAFIPRVPVDHVCHALRQAGGRVGMHPIA